MYSKRDNTTNIFIVDSQLGFVFWLGHILAGTGIECWPARNVEDAQALIRETGVIAHILIINDSIPEASAFAEDLLQAQGHLKVIRLRNRGEKARKALLTDFWLERPVDRSVSAGLECLAVIRRAFAAELPIESHVFASGGR